MESRRNEIKSALSKLEKRVVRVGGQRIFIRLREIDAAMLIKWSANFLLFVRRGKINSRR